MHTDVWICECLCMCTLLLLVGCCSSIFSVFSLSHPSSLHFALFKTSWHLSSRIPFELTVFPNPWKLFMALPNMNLIRNRNVHNMWFFITYGTGFHIFNAVVNTLLHSSFFISFHSASPLYFSLSLLLVCYFIFLCRCCVDSGLEIKIQFEVLLIELKSPKIVQCKTNAVWLVFIIQIGTNWRHFRCAR